MFFFYREPKKVTKSLHSRSRSRSLPRKFKSDSPSHKKESSPFELKGIVRVKSSSPDRRRSKSRSKSRERKNRRDAAERPRSRDFLQVDKRSRSRSRSTSADPDKRTGRTSRKAAPQDHPDGVARSKKIRSRSRSLTREIVQSFKDFRDKVRGR